MAKIHTKLKPKADQTGLWLLGRNRDGRYQYQSVSVFRRSNIVNLTHEARVGLAVTRKLLDQTFGRYDVYPMTRNGGGAIGYGEIGQRRMWIVRYELESIGRAFLAKKDIREQWKRGRFSTVVHEAGHNLQERCTRPHGPEFKAAEVRAHRMLEATIWKGWPKLDMRKLRDSKVRS